MPESLLEAYESYDPVIVQGCPISSLNIAEASIWLLYHFPMTTNDVKLLEVTLDGGGGELGSDFRGNVEDGRIKREIVDKLYRPQWITTYISILVQRNCR